MAKITLSILLGTIIIARSVYCAIPTTEFFPYGTANGDARLPNGRGIFEEVPLSSGRILNFFNSSYSRLFVNSNGAISFTQGNCRIYVSCWFRHYLYSKHCCFVV